MLTVSIKHPDSEAFIDAKMTEGKITGANVSVKIDDDFMNAAISGKDYVQQLIGKAFSQLHFHSPTFGFEGIEELGASPGLLLSVLKPNARSIPDAGHGQSCGSLEPGVGGKRKSYGLWRL